MFTKYELFENPLKLDTKAPFDDLDGVKRMRFSETDRLHREERARDRKRIALDKVTSAQVQEENSIVPLHTKITFVNFHSYIRQAYA